jgi:hypothetical protein
MKNTPNALTSVGSTTACSCTHCSFAMSMNSGMMLSRVGAIIVHDERQQQARLEIVALIGP